MPAKAGIHGREKHKTWIPAFAGMTEFRQQCARTNNKLISGAQDQDMHPLRKRLFQFPVVRFLASLKITVTCLFLLFLLTLWGTIAQVEIGLYQAQQQFFNSWFFPAFGFLPFPGAQGVMLVLFFNLLCAFTGRFAFRWRNLGLLMTHIGLLIYFVAAYVTFQVAQETSLTLREGETADASKAYHHWELALWPKEGGETNAGTAVDSRALRTGESIVLDTPPATLEITSYYKNAAAYTAAPADFKTDYLNTNNIKHLAAEPLEKEPEKNLPGLILKIRTEPEGAKDVLLFGGESGPTPVSLNGRTYNLQLRLKKFKLPFSITLNKFEREFHPGTETPRAFRSFVTIAHDGLERTKEIYMNHPLRFKDFTLYQASYAVDQAGRELSTLAVVRNSGRLLPYIASFVTFGGLALHFLVMAFRKPGGRRP
jgi:hypothetical protein